MVTTNLLWGLSKRLRGSRLDGLEVRRLEGREI